MRRSTSRDGTRRTIPRAARPALQAVASSCRAFRTNETSHPSPREAARSERISTVAVRLTLALHHVRFWRGDPRVDGERHQREDEGHTHKEEEFPLPEGAEGATVQKRNGRQEAEEHHGRDEKGPDAEPVLERVEGKEHPWRLRHLDAGLHLRSQRRSIEEREGAAQRRKEEAVAQDGSEGAAERGRTLALYGGLGVRLPGTPCFVASRGRWDAVALH